MGLPAWRDRVEDGEREIEEAGGKLVGVWVTLGRYDVVEVFEAPDDDTALAVLDPVAPGRQAHPPLRGPADERDVVRHGRIFSSCD